MDALKSLNLDPRGYDEIENHGTDDAEQTKLMKVVGKNDL